MSSRTNFESLALKLKSLVNNTDNLQCNVSLMHTPSVTAESLAFICVYAILDSNLGSPRRSLQCQQPGQMASRKEFNLYHEMVTETC